MPVSSGLPRPSGGALNIHPELTGTHSFAIAQLDERSFLGFCTAGTPSTAKAVKPPAATEKGSAAYRKSVQVVLGPRAQDVQLPETEGVAESPPRGG